LFDSKLEQRRLDFRSQQVDATATATVAADFNRAENPLANEPTNESLGQSRRERTASGSDRIGDWKVHVRPIVCDGLGSTRDGRPLEKRGARRAEFAVKSLGGLFVAGKSACQSGRDAMVAKDC